jgi:hypothetical protein
MRWRSMPVVLALSVGLVSVTVASAAVKPIALTPTVTTGRSAKLTVGVSPKARCTLRITVKYGDSVPRAVDLEPKTGGRITWRWRVRPNVEPGRLPMIVRCGESGTLKTGITIVPAEPPMSVREAADLVCGQELAKAQATGYQFVRTVRTRPISGAHRCSFFGVDGHNYYLRVSLLAQCRFTVRVQETWANGRPGQRATTAERSYIATCSSLRR